MTVRAWQAAVACLTLAFGGCGFHLQGHTPLPEVVRTPYVQTVDKQSEFIVSLRRAMLSSGAHPVEQKDKASVVVQIIKDDVVRRTLSVSAQNQPDGGGAAFLKSAMDSLKDWISAGGTLVAIGSSAGAFANHTRNPALIPNFFGSGVPEYPGILNCP